MSDTRMQGGTANNGRLTAKEEAALQAAKNNPAMATLLDGATLDGLAEPEFRVLSLMGERKGIRLESVFWEALEQIAAEQKVPRNTLVLWIMAAAGHDRHNVTSVLRSVAVGYLLAEIERLKTPPAENG